MDIVQPSGVTPSAQEFRHRNDELFARRKELEERLAELRAKADAGRLDTISELLLSRTERAFEDVTLEIMVTNYGLVRRYVAMFTSKSHEHSEDFESAGKVGLLWAISSYDPSRGPFASWAFKPIQREVLRAVRDADHPNLSPGDFEKRPVILAAEREYLQEAGSHAPLDHDAIARRAGVSPAQVRRVLEPPRLDSLNRHAGGAEDEDDGQWEDKLSDPSMDIEEQVLRRWHLRAIATSGMPSLHPRERYVLTRRFGLDGGQEQSLRIIGEELGLSREGVRQIQQKALAKLTEPIEDAC